MYHLEGNGRVGWIPTWLQEFEKEAGHMAFDKDWRPENWDRIKENIVTETPITFSPSAGYSKDQKDQLMEKSASAVLGALKAVIVSGTKE